MSQECHRIRRTGAGFSLSASCITAGGTFTITRAERPIPLKRGLMAADLTQQELRRLALVGAEARLRELEQERATLLRIFPGLRGSRNASIGTPATRAASQPGRRRRRRMSAAARKAVSQRMKRYWAARRAGRAKGAASR